MELVYLWVDKYKNIEKQGFNLSPRFRCNYNSDTNELKIEKNEDYIDIFPENVKFTAIVGKNGSGKSSLLEILKYFQDCNGCFILIYDEKENIFYISSEEIRTDNLIVNQEFKVSKTLKTHKIHNIYYTNNILFYPDFDNVKQFSRHLENISNEYLFEKVSEQIQNQYKHNLYSFLRQIKPLFESEMIQYGLRAFYEKGIQFPNDWQEFQYIFIDFDFRYILTSFDYKIKKLREKFDSEDNNSNKEIENLLYIKNLINYKIGIKNRIDWEYFIKYLCILNFIVSAYNGIGGLIHEKIIFQAIENVKAKIGDILNDLDKSYNAIDSFIITFDKDFIVDGAINSLPRQYFNKVNKLISKLDKFGEYFDKQNYRFKLPLNKDSINDTLEIIKLHQEITVTVAKFLNFDLYPWMSDGHKEFFYIFSKIFMALETPFDKPKKNETIILLLDEIINFIHPNWHKQFIKIIYDFLSNNYKQYQFQIILTTHSPFIISDLPKQNIIFLDKDENGKCRVVDGLKEKKETFGANIHTLLSDSFFMEDGLIGKYAEEKINDVINYLIGKESNIKDDTKAQKYINIIGEPIIKKELQRMLDSKRLEKVQEIDVLKRNIAVLQARLEKLENEKDNNN